MRIKYITQLKKNNIKTIVRILNYLNSIVWSWPCGMAACLGQQLQRLQAFADEEDEDGVPVRNARNQRRTHLKFARSCNRTACIESSHYVRLPLNFGCVSFLCSNFTFNFNWMDENIAQSLNVYSVQYTLFVNQVKRIKCHTCNLQQNTGGEWWLKIA